MAGACGGQLLHTDVASSRESRLIAAILELKTRFAEPVRVHGLAAIARMSSATVESLATEEGYESATVQPRVCANGWPPSTA
jgi:transcriptional regulator GlxA family with amidase domain